MIRIVKLRCLQRGIPGITIGIWTPNWFLWRFCWFYFCLTKLILGEAVMWFSSSDWEDYSQTSLLKKIFEFPTPRFFPSISKVEKQATTKGQVFFFEFRLSNSGRWNSQFSSPNRSNSLVIFDGLWPTRTDLGQMWSTRRDIILGIYIGCVFCGSTVKYLWYIYIYFFFLWLYHPQMPVSTRINTLGDPNQATHVLGIFVDAFSAYTQSISNW